jgi:hypothetical protein
MFTLLLALALAKPSEVNVVDGQWRAMQVLRAQPDRYRVIKQPIVIENGPVKLTLTEGVMVPVFSGFTDNDKEGRIAAKADAWELDSKSPPPLEDGEVQFVGFVFAAAKGTYEVRWQERADNLIFANHMVTHLNQPREDWLDVAHAESWTGEVTEGFVLSRDEKLMADFLGPEDVGGDPHEVIVYQKREYVNARLRAKILFHDRREVMKRIGYRPGRHIGWDRIAESNGLQTATGHTIMDLHIDRNLGDMTRRPGGQPKNIDWISMLQDWTGTMDSRRHTVLTSLDLDIEERLVANTITGMPFPPSTPGDPLSAPRPPARLVSEDAFVIVRSVPVTAHLTTTVTARLQLRAEGGDFSVFQLYVPRAGFEHDWTLDAVTLEDGTSLLSKAPLIELHPLGEIPASSQSVSATEGGGAPIALEEGKTSSGLISNRASAAAMMDANHNRAEARISLALPEPLRDGERVVVDVTWTDRWPLGKFVRDEQATVGLSANAGEGNEASGTATDLQLAPASGAQGVVPRPAGSSRDSATKFRIQIAVPEHSALKVSVAGATYKQWEDAGFRMVLAGQQDHAVPFPDVHIGQFHIHDEPASHGMPAIRTRTFGKRDGQQLAIETRAQIAFLEGYLPNFPWKEHEVTIGPGATNQLWASAGHGITGLGKSASTGVTGGMTRQNGNAANTTQRLMTHELAHQWWGQSLQPAHASDAWFTETLAESFAQMYTGSLHDTYERTFRQKRRRFESMMTDPITRVPLVEAYESPLESAILFDYGPYLMQEMLRPRIGSDRYHGAFDLLAREHAHSTITTERIQDYLEQANGSSLDDFFDFWVYGGFIPKKVALRWEWKDGQFNGELTCDVPFGAFDVAVDIDGDTHWVDIKDGTGTLNLALATEPESVQLDPDHRTLIVKRTAKRVDLD